jgi:hypothetical protein
VRNNSGYDFGGYQAAIEHLQSTGHIYDHLHIINDSILMPIVENQSIMEDIEKAATTGFGGVASLPIDHKRPQGSQIALSYWLYFSGQITRSHAFASYWGSYIATNSKVLTVRHGERGISSHMIEAGHPPATLLSLEKLASKIESLDSRSLHAILKYGSYTDQNFIDQSRHLLKIYRDSGEWTDSARKFVIEVSNRRNYIHSFCFLAINVLGLPFIKKSDTMLIKLMREKYLEAVDSGDVDTKSSRLVEKILKVTRCTPHMTQDSIKNPAGPASG